MTGVRVLTMRDYICSATGICGLVFSILGVVFTLVGAILAVALPIPAIGVVFVSIGVPLLVAAAILVPIRMKTVRRLWRLQQSGRQTQGTIVEVVQSRYVKINHRGVWIVRYRYEVAGQVYQGSENFIDRPAQYQPGGSVAIMYDPDRADLCALKRPAFV
jgi:hypothetical protein